MFLPNIEYSVNQTLAKRTKYQILQSVLTASNDHKNHLLQMSVKQNMQSVYILPKVYPCGITFLLFWVVTELGYERV